MQSLRITGSIVCALGMLFSGSLFAQRAHRVNSPSIYCDPDTGCGDTGGGGGGGGGSSGASKVVYHKVDSVAHTAELQFDNGATMVIDYPANKMLISGGGHTAELSLDAVLLQKANGNATLAASLKSQLRSKLYKPGLIIDMASSGGSAGLMAKNSGQRSAGQGLLAGPSGGYYGYNCYYYYYCYEGSFTVADWGGYNAGFAAGQSYPPDNSPDYNYWDIWREDHCDSMQSDFRNAGASVLTMMVGCAFFETGIGALACGAGGVGVYMSMDSAADNASVCLSHYPGYGNWGH